MPTTVLEWGRVGRWTGGAIVLLAGFCGSALADAIVNANSNNWFFNKYENDTFDTHHYWSATNAAAATFDLQAQAFNEGGNGDWKHFGPSPKFNPGPATKTWPLMLSEVPAPGTTKAKGSASGFTSVQTGLDGLTFGYYYASDFVSASVDKSTIPSGGFGRAYGKTMDPWVLSLPVFPASGTSTITLDGQTTTASPGDVVTMHSFLDLTGSGLTYDPDGGGTMDWNVTMGGLTSSATPTTLLHYSLAGGAGFGGPFSSALAVSPDVRFYLNDYDSSIDPLPGPANVHLEPDPAFAVTPAELKAFLDGFALSGGSGWSLGSAPALIEMVLTIPNDAPGNPDLNPGDPDNRFFDYHSDVYAEVQDATVSAPATLVLMALLLTFTSLIRVKPQALYPRRT